MAGVKIHVGEKPRGIRRDIPPVDDIIYQSYLLTILTSSSVTWSSTLSRAQTIRGMLLSAPPKMETAATGRFTRPLPLVTHAVNKEMSKDRISLPGHSPSKLSSRQYVPLSAKNDKIVLT